MKENIISLTLLSALFMSRLNAVITPDDTVNVPDASTTGVLVGVGVLGVFVIRQFFRRK